MELRDTILKRRMARNFADKPVEPQIIDQIVQLTRQAPASRRDSSSSWSQSLNYRK